MFCMSGQTNPLVCDIFPPIELGSIDEWECGLVNLCTYNTIPNIEKGINDLFVYNGRNITIPEGSYEITDIEDFIRSKLLSEEKLVIIANNNTLKCEIQANYEIDFTATNTIGWMLGFGSKILPPNIRHCSEHPVTIIKVNSVRIDCNIARGSYSNGVEGHTLHEFFPTVPPGYKISETPSTIIYMPVNTSKVHNISVEITDQDGRLINFRGETITVRVHLRKRYK